MHLSSMCDCIHSLEDAQSQLRAENVAMKIQLNSMAASRVATQQQTDVHTPEHWVEDVQKRNINMCHGMFLGDDGFRYSETFRSSHNQEVLNIISAFCKGSPDGCVLNDRDLCHQIWVFFDGQKKISRLTPEKKKSDDQRRKRYKRVWKKLQYCTKIECQHRESLKEHYDGGEKLL
ncbi:hypothetical protein BDA99DRAFT_544622 [Phascolomyces articulosus]|uniref:Uncharacterized protein n=1 Tax=Phascolomyces articulosus TaxID=60185 RepID=A0AAD5JVL2_9FUNG|nr:hypothetical protein BDA99DRAFT_544622 [Phascolomyces articulosus]